MLTDVGPYLSMTPSWQRRLPDAVLGAVGLTVTDDGGSGKLGVRVDRPLQTMADGSHFISISNESRRLTEAAKRFSQSH